MVLCVDTESINGIRVQENGFSRTSWRIQIVVLQLIYSYAPAGQATGEYADAPGARTPHKICEVINIFHEVDLTREQIFEKQNVLKVGVALAAN